MLLILLIIVAAIWIFSWGGPRYYPAYATRYARYPFWGGSSHALLVLLVVLFLLWWLGIIKL